MAAFAGDRRLSADEVKKGDMLASGIDRSKICTSV